MKEKNIVNEMALQKSKIITTRKSLKVQITVGMYDGTFMEDFSEEVIFDMRSERYTNITKGRDSIGTLKVGTAREWEQCMQRPSGGKRHGMLGKLK